MDSKVPPSPPIVYVSVCHTAVSADTVAGVEGLAALGKMALCQALLGEFVLTYCPYWP